MSKWTNQLTTCEFGAAADHLEAMRLGNRNRSGELDRIEHCGVLGSYPSFGSKSNFRQRVYFGDLDLMLLLSLLCFSKEIRLLSELEYKRT